MRVTASTSCFYNWPGLDAGLDLKATSHRLVVVQTTNIIRTIFTGFHFRFDFQVTFSFFENMWLIAPPQFRLVRAT